MPLPLHEKSPLRVSIFFNLGKAGRNFLPLMSILSFLVCHFRLNLLPGTSSQDTALLISNMSLLPGCAIFAPDSASFLEPDYLVLVLTI